MKICLVYTLASVGRGIYRKLKVPISRIDGEKISCLPHGFTNSEISNLESRLFTVRQKIVLMQRKTILGPIK